MTFNNYEAERLKLVLLALAVVEMPAVERQKRFDVADPFEVFQTYTDSHIRHVVDLWKMQRGEL